MTPRAKPALLDDRLTTANPDPGNDEPTLPLSHPVHLRRAGKEVRMVIDHTDPFAPPPKPDRALIRLVTLLIPAMSPSHSEIMSLAVPT
jgi:hypothetical protein